MIEEQQRMADEQWKKWGPYVSNRQWGTVREDYSPNGNAWGHTTHHQAISKTYRWNEDGIAGICDDKQRLCFAFSFWNGKDEIIKERFFGLSNHEGNHGEDIKELFYYLDNTPSHSYMKMVYKYPTVKFPYHQIVEENRRRTKKEPEFEISDTEIFENNQYFDLFIEYAKINHDDIAIRLTAVNRSDEKTALHVLPTLWYRNNWAWGNGSYRPDLKSSHSGIIDIGHESVCMKKMYARDQQTPALFCNNESNPAIVEGASTDEEFYKDGINNFIIHGDETAVNPQQIGSKACFNVSAELDAGQTRTFDFRLSPHTMDDAFFDFDEVFEKRKEEADGFYNQVQCDIKDQEEKKHSETGVRRTSME